MSLTQESPLLSADDPDPVEIVNENSDASVLLLCEHAGQHIPRSLDRLGVTQATIDSHRGWDIGALAVAREVAAQLGAPLIIQRYSRLVIDSNRPPDSPSAVPALVDGTAIPGNAAITTAAQRQRARAIFEPLNQTITRMMDSRKPRGCFSIHSFSPVLGGVSRPWHAGFLSRRDTETANALMRSIAAQKPGLTLAVNEPYQVDDETDWFIPRHAEPAGAAHSLIEIRNDLITSSEGVTLWAGLLAQAITSVMQEKDT